MVNTLITGRAKFIQLDIFKLGPERSVGAEDSNKGRRKWEAKKTPGLQAEPQLNLRLT
jgi:hypothetical protein